MKYNPEEIGKRLKGEREKAHLTQSQLAKKINVTNKQISNYEHGTPIPPLDNLLLLCDVFNCELGYILGEDDYSRHTRIKTIICEETSLSEKAIDAIINTTHQRIEPIENRDIINTLFTSNIFDLVIDRLLDVKSAVSEYNSVIMELNKKYDKAILDEAWDVYNDSSIDYLHDVDFQNSHAELADPLKDIDACIDKTYDKEFNIKVARYDLSKILEKLVDDMFPISTFQ